MGVVMSVAYDVAVQRTLRLLILTAGGVLLLIFSQLEGCPSPNTVEAIEECVGQGNDPDACGRAFGVQMVVK